MKNFFYKSIINKFVPYIIFLFVVFSVFYNVFFNEMILKGNQDRMDQNVPAVYYYYRAFFNHEIPQWNPYILCGTSGLGNAYCSYFYPFIFPVYLFGENLIPLVLTFLVMIHYYFALVFAFLFINALFKDRMISIISAIIYALSGALLYNLTIGLTNILCFTYFPLLMYLVITNKKRSVFLNIFLNSIVLGLLLLGGNPQIIIYILGFYFFYALFQYFEVRDKKFILNNKLAVIVIISIIIAFMIGSIRILPFYFWKGMEKSSVSLANFAEYIKNYRIMPVELLRLFSSYCLGVSDGYLGKNLDFFESFFTYISLPAVFMALYGLIFIWDNRTLFFKIMTLGIILTVLGTPVTLLHYLVTGSDTIYFTRVYYFLPICLSLFFASALTELIKDKKRFKTLFYFSVILSVMITISLLLIFIFKNESGERNTVDLIIFSIIYFIIVSLLSIALFFIFYKYKINANYMIVILALIIFLDVYYINITREIGRYLLTEGSLFKTEKDVNKVTKIFNNNNKLFRINDVHKGSDDEDIGEDENNCNDMNIVFNYYASYGYDNIIPKRLIKLYRFSEDAVKRYRKIWPRDLRTNQITSSITYADKTKIHETPDCLPRVKLYYKYKLINDDELIIDTLHQNDFDYKSTVLLNKKPLFPVSGYDHDSKVIIYKENFNSLIIKVITLHNCILLLNDTFDEGWKLKLNGRNDEILIANYAFKAVSVPSGTHLIELEYMHKGLKEGIVLFFISMIILFFIFFLSIFFIIVNKSY
ncbi:MAG: YfhO family protein [Spirochaetes bacterium]|nr:YfhO family protein [Spirochaetota bacterium]